MDNQPRDESLEVKLVREKVDEAEALPGGLRAECERLMRLRLQCIDEHDDQPEPEGQPDIEALKAEISELGYDGILELLKEDGQAPEAAWLAHQFIRAQQTTMAEQAATIERLQWSVVSSSGTTTCVACGHLKNNEKHAPACVILAALGGGVMTLPLRRCGDVHSAISCRACILTDKITSQEEELTMLRSENSELHGIIGDDKEFVSGGETPDHCTCNFVNDDGEDQCTGQCPYYLALEAKGRYHGG